VTITTGAKLGQKLTPCSCPFKIPAHVLSNFNVLTGEARTQLVQRMDDNGFFFFFFNNIFLVVMSHFGFFGATETVINNPV
jgi:hypothetical protein